MEDSRDLLEFDETGTIVVGCKKSAKEIVIPEGVTEIGCYSFYDCDTLISITIPNSVKKIGRSAFVGCRALTSIEIPNNVTEIISFTFYDCSALTSITIPNSVTEIGRCAFQGCSALTSIQIPNNVTSIRGMAFHNCRTLKSITIPNSLTKIGYRTLSGCQNLKTIRISENHPCFKYENGKLIDKKTGNIIAQIEKHTDDHVDTEEFIELQQLYEQTKAEFDELKVHVDIDKKKYESDLQKLNEQLEEEKKSHEQTKKKLAELEAKGNDKPNNSITIDDMISIIGEQATAEDAKTISDALTIIVLEKGMKVTKEQNKKMKANLAKLANPSPMVSTGTNSGIMASNINIQMPEEERKQLTSSMKK